MTVKRYDAPKLRAWSDDAQGFCVVESADYDALLSLNSELLEALADAESQIRLQLSLLKCDEEFIEKQVQKACAAIAKARSQS